MTTTNSKLVAAALVAAGLFMGLTTNSIFAEESFQQSSPNLTIDGSESVVDSISIVDSFTIADVRIGVDITHSFIGDLDLSIEKDGISVALFDGSSEPSANINVSFSAMGLPFNDQLLQDGLGTWLQPQQDSLNAFDGLISAGVWTLSVGDSFELADSGVLNSWSVTVSDVIPAPSNDNCDAAVNIEVDSALPFDTNTASSSGQLPACDTGAPIDSWFRFTPSCDGSYRFTLSSDDMTERLTVWNFADGCGTLSSLGCSLSTGIDATVILTLDAGQEVAVQVGGAGTTTGTGLLAVTIESVTPSNDRCIDATPIENGTVFDSSNCASSFGIYNCTASAPDLWYSITASCDGILTIDTFGSDFDTTLAIYDACGGTEIACNDDAGSAQSEVTLLGVQAGEQYLIQVAGFNSATGNIQLNANCVVPPIENLACASDLFGAILNWTSPMTYSSLEVVLDGTVIETIAGDATSYTLSGLESKTSYQVCIRVPAVSTIETCCSFTTNSTGIDADGRHILFALEPASAIDSSAALDTALSNLGFPPLLVDEQDVLQGTPATIWVVCGTFPNKTPISQELGTQLKAWIESGIPVFVSGGDVWGLDPVTDFNLVDGVADLINDNGPSFDNIIGEGFASGLDASYNFESFFEKPDNLIPSSTDILGSDAQVAFSTDASSTFDVGIAYYPTGGAGNVLCTSFEFGGYQGDLDALGLRCIQFLVNGITGPAEEFRRGDVNLDFVIDIADAVGLLNVLFSGAVAAGCDDGMDTNDDGTVNVADAVSLLGFLFDGGSEPPLPGPDNCGVDPTNDALDCTNSCPST